MGTREVSSRSGRDSAADVRALRSRWRTASIASGWRFPTDWAIPEVDQVCVAVLAGTAPEAALGRLAGARARAGCGLGETLQDVAALHAVLTVPEHRDGMVAADPDALPAHLLRVTAIAWSDVLLSRLAHAEPCDGLTGLATTAYLRVRLREVYREAAAAGTDAPSRYALVVVSPDLGSTSGWSRLGAMALLADVLRAVFDGGQTLAAIAPTTLLVLAARDCLLSRRMAATRWLSADRLRVDESLRSVGAPSVWLETLPDTHSAACRLLTELATV